MKDKYDFSGAARGRFYSATLRASVARLDRFSTQLDRKGGAFLAAMSEVYQEDNFAAAIEALGGDLQLVVALAKEALKPERDRHAASLRDDPAAGPQPRS